MSGTGSRFDGASAIYAEHFLEHLTLTTGSRSCGVPARALADTGVLRLSTPNLDWVYADALPVAAVLRRGGQCHDCLQLNRAFHGWGHQFLYNRATLEKVLKRVPVSRRRRVPALRRERHPELKGIERHETWVDTPELPHVLVAEASGEAREEPLPASLLEEHRVAVSAK